MPSERARYTSMGGVVVGTAIMAMLSMAAALYWLFDGFQPFIVIAVPVWGMFVLSLDRWLMSSTSVSQSSRTIQKVLPRVLLSIALGVVLAEPLLLGVYHTAISERTARDRQTEITDREVNLRACNPAAGAVTDNARCQQYVLRLDRGSLDALQGRFDDLTKQQATLKATVDTDAVRYAELDNQARLECAGGSGAVCTRLRLEADRYRADHSMDANAAKLTELNNQLSTLAPKLSGAQGDYASAVDAAIRDDLDQVRARQRKGGVIERFRVLADLVSENGYVQVTQWAIRIFIVLVDALPVLLIALTGVSAYDRVMNERLSAQERIQRLRSAEEFDRHSHYGDLVRHETDLRYRARVEQVDEQDRIERANYDERRGALIDALEQHLLRTAMGPATAGWRPDEPDRRSSTWSSPTSPPRRYE